jgi:hypothetical protein
MTARAGGKRRHDTLQYVTFHMDGLVGRWKGERRPGQWLLSIYSTVQYIQRLQSHADASIHLSCRGRLGLRNRTMEPEQQLEAREGRQHMHADFSLSWQPGTDSL